MKSKQQHIWRDTHLSHIYWKVERGHRIYITVDGVRIKAKMIDLHITAKAEEKMISQLDNPTLSDFAYKKIKNK